MINKKTIEWLTCFIICMPFIFCFNRELFSIYNSYSLEIILIYLVIVFISSSIVQAYEFILICVIFIICLCSVLFANSGYGSVITILEPVVLLLLIDNISLSEKHVKLINKVLIIVLFYLMYKSFFYSEDWLYFQDNDINPNTIGMLVILIYMICAANEEKVIYKILFLLVTSVVLINVRCRGASVALISFLLCSAFIRNVKQHIKLLIILLTFIGTVFPVVYYELYSNDIDLNFMGKSLFTGREMIWVNAFNEMSINNLKFIFGLGSKADLWAGHDLNVHNNFLGVIVNYGICGFICIFYYLGRKIICWFSGERSEKQCKYYLISVVMIYILGIFETTLLWTTMIVLVMSGIIFGNNCRR